MTTFFIETTCTKSEGYIGGYCMSAYAGSLNHQEITTASSVSARRGTAVRRSGCILAGALAEGVR